MRLKRVENSIAFWALSLLVYGLCFSLIRVQAEALYRKTPHLTARTRMEVPKASPMLDLKPDNRVHDTPPPSINGDLVPVSWQPEKSERQNPEPSTRLKPAPAQGQRSMQPKSPPQNRASALPSAAPSSLSKNSVVAAPKGRVRVEEAVAFQTTTAPVARPSGEKPLVHFPQDLPDTRSAANRTDMEPGFYPVGYRPYLPASIVMVSGKHQEALSHYNRGSYYGHADQLAQAIREYQQAIRKNPELADAYVGLSSAYLLKNQWEEVFTNARKALSLKAGFMDPANIIQAKFNLSTAYCAADDYKQARFFYNSVKLANHAQTAELWEYLKKNCKHKP